MNDQRGTAIRLVALAADDRAPDGERANAAMQAALIIHKHGLLNMGGDVADRASEAFDAAEKMVDRASTVASKAADVVSRVADSFSSAQQKMRAAGAQESQPKPHRRTKPRSYRR